MISDWTSLDTWIVIVGALSAMACALPGVFLVLRRMSMMGDAISHTVLPGLAIAFLISGSRGSFEMFVGAIAIGIITAVLIQCIHTYGSIEEGAAMGVVFTTLFAIGLILIRRAADNVDLDADCVLYGAIELTPLDTVSLFGSYIPIAAITNGAMLLVNGLVIALLYKELKISSFDAAHAEAVGCRPGLMHYLLMTLVAATCVAAFESVGSILVIAMLILPGACAYLITDRLWAMILLSLVFAATFAFFGHYAAIIVPGRLGFSGTSTAGMMAAVAGLIFLVCFLAAPRYGVLGRLLGRLRLSIQIRREDVLAYLYRIEMNTAQPAGATAAAIAERVGAGVKSQVAMYILTARGFIMPRPEGYTLTESGRQRARKLVRTHRLWESYLVEKAGVPPDSVHASAEALEHHMTAEMQGRLARETASPRKDPHGSVIPDSETDG